MSPIYNHHLHQIEHLRDPLNSPSSSLPHQAIYSNLLRVSTASLNRHCERCAATSITKEQACRDYRAALSMTAMVNETDEKGTR